MKFKIIILILFILSLLFGAVLFLEYRPIVVNAQLEDLKWYKPADLVPLWGQVEGEDHLGVFRAKDGAEQVVHPTLDVDYHTQDSLFIFGYGAPKEDEQVQYLYWLNELGARPYKLVDDFGKILSIKMNPKRSYFLIERYIDERNEFCIALNESVEDLVCEPLINKIENSDNLKIIAAWWHNKEERLLMIETKENEEFKVFQYDPWEKVALIAEQALSFNSKPITISESSWSASKALDRNFVYKRYLNYVVAQDTVKQVKSGKIIPMRASLYWLGDSRHILVVLDDKVYVWEVLTNKVAEFVSGMEVTQARTIGY